MIHRKKKEGICFIWSIIVHKHLKIKINFKKIFKKWIISFFLLIFVYFFKLIINWNILIHPADKINCFEHWSNTRNKSWIILESLKKRWKNSDVQTSLIYFSWKWGGGYYGYMTLNQPPTMKCCFSNRAQAQMHCKYLR